MRLLLVSHGPLVQTGGGSARWRTLVPHLRAHGWTVDVVSASAARSSDPFARAVEAGRAMDRRAAWMRRLRRGTAPLWRTLGLRPPPLSMLWSPRGALEVRRRLRHGGYDLVLATAPQMASLVAGRMGALGSGVPLVVELRDLWAGNPAYHDGGRVLPRVERWVLAGARLVIATTPEAVASLRSRHPGLAGVVRELPNGFEEELLQRRPPRAAASGPVTLVHSGTLLPHRPLAPLLRVLEREPYRSGVRLVLHGYLSPETLEELARARGCDVRVLPPSPWREAVDRIVEADAALITQAREAGDATAVAAKVYEYLALGKPVVCLTDGGATEGFLRRIGADRFCARLSDEASIEAALHRLLTEPRPDPVPEERLLPYARSTLAAGMARLLEEAAARLAPVPVEAAETKERVREFWNESPCGSALTEAPEGSPEFFAGVERRRYEAEPFIPELAGFGRTAGKRVLEIGVGLGTDFVQFARAGAQVTGVDLTPRSVELVRRRLELEGLTGDVRVADAEQLPFADGSFDHVYSWGVLHHTPDTARAVREAIRVVAPGGTLCVMLYGRRSWVALRTWVRHAALAGRPFQSLSQVLAEHMESEGTKAYTNRELRELFPGVDDLRIRSVVTVYDRRYWGPVARLGGNRLGWFRVVTGTRRAG